MTIHELTETAKQLIAIPSSAEQPQARWQALELMASKLARQSGVTIERFKSNNTPSLLAYAGPTRPARFDVLLNAHIDIVPGTPEQYLPTVKNGRLYGRGAYDMKMAAVVLTDIFCQHAVSSPLHLGLQIVTDEEVGGFNGAKVQVKSGVAADFAIFGEMTDLAICNETRGVCWLEVGFKGARAHGGYPWEGKNAITQASDFAQAILKKFPLPQAQTWVTTANIAAISTENTTFNMVPDAAVVKIDFRFIPEDPHFSSKEAVTALIKELAPDAVLMDIPVFDQAVHTPATNPQLALLMQTYKQVTGREPELIRRYGSSDTRYFASRGTSCVEFGLGGKNLHADNEYVDLASIEPYRASLKAFLKELARAKSTTVNHKRLADSTLAAH